MNEDDAGTLVAAGAAFEYCRNRTLHNEIIRRARNAVNDSEFANEFVARKVRSAIQEVYGANEYTSRHLLGGRFAIPHPKPNQEACDSQLFEIWDKGSFGTMESKLWHSNTNFSKVYKEFQPGGPYEGQVPNLNSELSDYFRSKGYEGEIIKTDVSDPKVQSVLEILRSGGMAQDQLSLTLCNAAMGGLVGGAVGGVISLAFNGYKVRRGLLDASELWAAVQTDVFYASISGVATGTLASFVTLTFPVGTLVAIGVAAVARKFGTAIVDDFKIAPEAFLRPLEAVELAKAEMIEAHFERGSRFVADTLAFVASMEEIDRRRASVKLKGERIEEESRGVRQGE